MGFLSMGLVMTAIVIVGLSRSIPAPKPAAVV